MGLTSLLLAACLTFSLSWSPARSAAGQTAPPSDPDLAVAQDPSLWKEDNEFTPFVGDRFDGFDWRLCMEVSRLAARNANLVVSPVSVKLLLAMLYEGAAGATAAELENALQLTRVEPATRRAEARKRFSNVVAKLQEANPDFQLELALRMYMDDNFTPRTRYNKILRYFYNVRLETVDFQKVTETAKNINSWVDNSTKGYIKDLVKADDIGDVEMMLANAVFFDGKWMSPFNEEDTADTVFYSSPGYAYNTSFMSQLGDYYYYNSSAVGAQILRLPYKGGKYSMFVVLPHERHGLDGVLEQLTPDRVRQLMWNMTLADVRVFLPRFAFDTRTDMKEVLRAMGVHSLFDRSADLQGVVARRPGGPLFVSSIVQKALVQVNEKGTVAAAATEASTTNRFGGTTKNVFSARHPFLFFIEDEATATVLFVGKVSEPHPLESQPPKPSDPGSAESGEFDLSTRFGGDFDRRPARPPVVVTNTIGGGEDPRFGPRRPESTTPQPGSRQQPPQPVPQPLPPYFNWLWRPNVYAGRTPTGPVPLPYSPHQTFNGQSGGGPQVFLVPLYVPIR